MRWLALLLPVLLLGGCGDKKIGPLLGKWTGGLEVLSVKTGGAPKAYELHGDLHLYVRKFEMNLTGPQQGVRVRGTWTYEGKRIKLKANDVSYPDNGGEEKRDPNKPYLDPKDLQSFFGREQTLNLSQDGNRIAGVEDAVANLVARLAFVKDYAR